MPEQTDKDFTDKAHDLIAESQASDAALRAEIKDALGMGGGAPPPGTPAQTHADMGLTTTSPPNSSGGLGGDVPSGGAPQGPSSQGGYLDLDNMPSPSGSPPGGAGGAPAPQEWGGGAPQGAAIGGPDVSALMDAVKAVQRILRLSPSQVLDLGQAIKSLVADPNLDNIDNILDWLKKTQLF